MDLFRVVETDNFGGDYPDESFAGPPVSKATAELVAAAFNREAGGDNARRFWKVEPQGYQLQPGFEP